MVRANSEASSIKIMTKMFRGANHCQQLLPGDTVLPLRLAKLLAEVRDNLLLSVN